MDPASYCVYNATRNALLGERVISVSEPQTPAQLLALVMNGPGRDPQVCIRLNSIAAGVSATPEIPRLFAFDVAYLDAEQRIVATADVGPGTPFPPVADNVTTILFLSDQLLPNSKSEAGDIIRICTGAELAALLRAAAQFQAIDSPAQRFESTIPQTLPDPFDGSLIYLPSSGMPQTREIFVPPPPLPSELVDRIGETSFKAEPAGNLSEDLIEPVTDLEDAREELQEYIGPVAALRSDESAIDVSPPLSAGVHSEQAAHAPPPRTSPLPFNLRAVIDLVDEQLRRERQPEEQASESRQPHWLAEAIVSAESSAAKTRTQDIAGEANLPVSEPPVQEDAISTPLLANGVSESPQVDGAAKAGVGAHPSEVLPVITRTAKRRKMSAPSSVRKAPQSEPVMESAQIPEPAAEPALPSVPPFALKAAVAPAEEPPASPREVLQPIRVPAKEKLPFAARVQRWLSGESISLNGNRRRGERVVMPGLVAFYFTGGAPKPHEILNISSSGLYLRSKELWSPNTLVRMTLERDDPGGEEKKSISVLARVVRVDDGGIGHEFVTTEVLARLNARDFLPSQGTNRKELDRFLAGSK